MDRAQAIRLAYLACAVLFIIGLKRLSSPATARSGNRIAAVGMLIAIVATFVDRRVVSYEWIGVGIAIGAVVGAVSARKVHMTAMPQMVALFNGVGGGAAALIALSEYHDAVGAGISPAANVAAASAFSAVVGAVSFAGSMVAFGKLQGIVTGRPVTWSGQKAANAVLLAAAVAVAAYVSGVADSQPLFFALAGIGAVLGVAGVMAIGGADMPVVISLLNSFTGLAAAATGFVLRNDVLIISGTLVGASGTLLTQMMGRAMNRSVVNVLFGAFGTGEAVPGSASAGGAMQVRSASAEDVAVMLAYARRVVVVPGYGLAVAQAQHQLSELAGVLERRGVDVRYAIHPVAGRMPGHMNVLLAEADVPYTQLYEMDDINPEFPRTDVALVIGANDVVNPAARTTPGSPIYGMPVLNVDEAAAVVVLKRGMSTGFAGVDNELFEHPKTTMLFGDARQSVTALVAAVRAL